jgi:hypothetical protein
MPEKRTIDRARRDKRRGKAATTQAGEFVREEMHHVKEGKHGARSRQQAVAIGLSKARRAGVDLPAPTRGRRKTRKSAAAAYKRGQQEGPLSGRRKRSRSTAKSPKRARASRKALERERKSV